ncbi:hypothetical protein [Candidatus Sulfurimonas baltica]|uniref:Uncharacterized protein n=1 Tax=Candidatus Sulfurimonas baltica TaxID=2740404 RepID=A0A7S7LZA4_9BACT|nr:hypothetical protein [Candidatus Sulfurimonas baltica]QOY53299.1 hypothetical protein HUE88_06390 [Candidatus Sulfurimonas baltica]
MQKIDNQEKDKFELHLDEMVIKIQSCQKNKDLISCSKCEHYFNCELRTDYVKSVYNSMSKGDTGGFEF